MSRVHLVLLAAGLLIVAVLLLPRLVDQVLFQPFGGVDVTPEQLGVPAESIFLTTADGVRVHAFFVPSLSDATAGAPRAILFLHGNAGNASHRLPNAVELARLGANVLLLDYRGYGLSEGRPNEQGVYADARAGLADLLEARGYPESRVVLFGRSLGGAVAVDLAVDRDFAGVILESTFSSARDAARSFFGPPAALLAGSRFDSASKIARLRSPLLFFHGDRDRIVAYDLGKRLFALAPEPKAFETLVGAGHNDTVIVGGRPYFERIRRFLDEVAPL
jgi:fermentation-respiration switch protein FrsA (DUF1100 family)